MDYERLGINILILTSVVAVVITVFAWHRRRTPTGLAFFGMTLCAMIWCTGVTLEMLTLDLDRRIFLTNVQFLGVTFLPLAELVMILAFTGRQPTRRLVLGLAVVPILTNLVIWTNPLHHWFRGQPYFESGTPFPTVVYDYQWWFNFVNIPQTYLYVLASIALAIQAIPKMPVPYRRQMVVFLGSLILPFIMNFLYVFGYSPIPHFDLTPATFSVVGILMIWNLFGFRFLDLLPVARDFVFEHMEEGILILDQRGRIVDINPAGCRMAEVDGGIIGKSLAQIAPPLAERLQKMIQTNVTSSDIAIVQRTKIFYELKISPIANEEDRMGEIIGIRDITERIELYNQVHDLAVHDGLTGVFTRRHFLELLKQPLSYIIRKPDYQISILLMDIDHFKRINDSFGHEGGDQALIAFSQMCQTNLRPMDAVGRWGGDEFIILLEDISFEEAQQAAERILQQIATLVIPTRTGDIRMTCSIGLASSSDFPTEELTAENLFHKADKALYFAKEHGRNRLATVRDLEIGSIAVALSNQDI